MHTFLRGPQIDFLSIFCQTVCATIPLANMNALAHDRSEKNFRGRVQLTALLGSAIWLTGCANL
ncbi:hypothetical protein, partial [Comamonas guangdongensis]|uniref:hypothetical protein n=1 Tax=Comamonas guangdongensis TaxID=510515 RepID=UPI0034E22DC1